MSSQLWAPLEVVPCCPWCRCWVFMCAQALMAASNASNEQRLALREDLKRQLADMRAMQEAAERAKAEQQELLARIAAMESKVWHLHWSVLGPLYCGVHGLNMCTSMHSVHRTLPDLS